LSEKLRPRVHAVGTPAFMRGIEPEWRR